MTTFKEIQGRNIRSYTTNPDNPLEGQMWYNQTELKLKGVVATGAWSAGSNMVTSVYGNGGAGTQTAGLSIGGNIGPGDVRTTAVEEYNGSGWATGGALPTATRSGGSAGTQTAAFYAGGFTGSDVTTAYNYDGSSWTTIPSIGTARRSLNNAGSGTTSASLIAGGYASASPESARALVEEYNGSSWSEQNDLPSAKANGASAGIQTATILAGGGPTPTNTSELYDGTSWTAGPTLNTPLTGRAASGTQTAAIVAGGRSPTSSATENYDGTSWTTNPATLATARYESAPATSGTNSATMLAGGFSTAITNLTEEYNFSAQVITPGAWASSGAMGTARSQISGFGASANASIGAGGYQYGPNAYTNASEEYNGSTFSATPNMPISMGFRNSGGTITAGIVFAGDSAETNTSLWDGSNYSNGPNLNNGGYGTMGNGSQTAAFIAGSSEPPSRPNTATEEYNGSSWSTVPGALNTGRGNGMGVGSQTAGLAIGGSPDMTNMEEYNGTAWTNGHVLVVGVTRSSAQGGSAPQDNTMIAGGGGSSAIATAQQYNGSSWVTAPSLAIARRQNGMGAGNSTSSMLVAGGNSPSITSSEEFTGETTAANVVDITTS
jgi:hypothetical protein